MCRSKGMGCLILACGLAFVTGSASDGSQPGQVLPGPFLAYVVTGPVPKASPEGVLPEERQNLGDYGRVGKMHDFVTRYGLDPTVALLIRESPPPAEQPLGILLRELDGAVEKYKAARLHAFAIFLTLKGPFHQDESQMAQIKQLESFAKQLKLEHVPLAIDQAESERSKAYQVPADATVVVLVYSKHTVLARFNFTTEKPLDEAGVKAILASVKSMVGTKK